MAYRLPATPPSGPGEPPPSGPGEPPPSGSGEPPPSGPGEPPPSGPGEPLPSGPGVSLPAGFDVELLAEVGLRPERLPTVLAPGEIAGRTGDPMLPPGIPVVIAGHDHAVGAYACGVREPGDVADSVGTAEAVMTVVAGHPDPVPVGRAGMSVVITASGRYRAVLAGSSGAGATVAWWQQHEGDVTAASGDRPTGVLVLPYLTGRQAPAPDPDARLRVVGRTAAHGPAELAKALLEGLSLQTRWMLTEQARLAGGDPAPTVYLFGGPVAANPQWARIKARVLPGPLRLVAEREPVAAGAAVLAAARTGLADATLPWLPLDRSAGDYDDMFTRFVAAATETDEDDR
jgi:xylulokinase